MSDDRDTSPLATGTFVTLSRIRTYCALLLLAYGVAVASLLLSADGLIDSSGRPLGTDFSNVWSAGQMALRGDAVEAFDPAPHYREQQAIFDDPEVPFYGWHYPPFFLGVAALLALIPYLPALLIWQISTGAAYVAMIRLISPAPILLLAALAYPAVFINITHGQNGLLTAALLGAGLMLLDRRPWLAGILIGLLAYKPHFGFLIPLVLLVTLRWRPILSASATVLTMAAGATVIFGFGVWEAFIEHADFTSTVILEAGATGWEKIHSIFSIARSLGAPVGVAYALQALLAAFLAIAMVWLWRKSDVDLGIKAAGLIAASVIVTPYALDYDMMALAPALALLALEGVKNGFAPYEKSALAFAWLAPLFSRTVADWIIVHPALAGAFLVFALALARARSENTYGLIGPEHQRA
ncbi:MAG: glycosyltransferase family 87 protein [Pseudomonadota bacterium]